MCGINPKPQSHVPLEEAVDYALNRDKTESVCFETGLSCLCETAFCDMRANNLRWHKTGGVQGYHLVQSFAEGEVTPELAHQIGVELADQLLSGQYQAVVTTHLNTSHIHNHIVWCAVALDNGRKYHSNARSYYTEVRAKSDALCRQYGLSVIETPESERGKRQYAKWQAETSGQPTWRTAIRMDVDEAISMALTWRQFLAMLEQKGYEIRMGRKYPTLRPPGKERFVRFKTLGKAYTPEAIRQRILYPKRPFTPAAGWRGRLHGNYRKARKLTGLRALYYRYLYELGALPRKPQRPQLCRAPGYPQPGQAHPADGIFVTARYRYTGPAGCLPPGSGKDRVRPAGRTPPTAQGRIGRCHRSQARANHAGPQAASTGHPPLPADCRTIGADARNG